MKLDHFAYCFSPHVAQCVGCVKFLHKDDFFCKFLRKWSLIYVLLFFCEGGGGGGGGGIVEIGSNKNRILMVFLQDYGKRNREAWKKDRR
jgi:hypothetical protein